MPSGNSAVYLKTLHAHGLLCLCSNVEEMADLWVSRVTIALPKSSNLIILVSALSGNSLQIAPTHPELGVKSHGPYQREAERDLTHGPEKDRMREHQRLR